MKLVSPAATPPHHPAKCRNGNNQCRLVRHSTTFFISFFVVILWICTELHYPGSPTQIGLTVPVLIHPSLNLDLFMAPLKAVTLTHVRYKRGDQFGHFLAWVSLVPVFISLCGFTCHIMFRRELQGMFFALGLLISQFINELIKSSVKQARPETCELLESCDSHGWPSSHSQFMFFFSVYYTLLTYKKLGILSRHQMWIAVLLVWPMALLTLYSRVYLGYHSVVQVFAGATLGAFLGGLWFWVVNYVLRAYFPIIEESALGRLFYIKDTSHIPNVLKFEYENARGARKHSSYKRND